MAVRERQRMRNLDQSNISNRGRPRLRRTSENESVVQERQGNPLAEIRNRSIVNLQSARKGCNKSGHHFGRPIYGVH